MISDAIQERVTGFTDRWRKLVASVPVLDLDGSWPSVGVLDLLTFRLRGKDSLERWEEQLLKISASYLGIIAHECWGEFDARVRLTDGERGVTLSADLPDGKKHSVEIERHLRTILQTIPSTLPVLDSFERQLPPTANYLSLFGIGLATGLSPYGEGAWQNETPETFGENLERAVRCLGRSSIRHFERLYPENLFGQVGDLYLAGLIYPPAFMAEVIPAQYAVQEIVTFCRSYKLNATDIRKLATHLALSPDELISSAGISLAAATVIAPLHRGFIGSCQARGTFVGLLRTPMLEARKFFGLREDWIFQEEHHEEDVSRFEIEKTLGFLPWVYLEGQDLRRKELRKPLKRVLAPLSFFDMETGVREADKVIAESPGLIEIRLQRLYLDVLNREFDRADNGFRALLTEPGMESEGRLFALWGLNDLWREDRTAGTEHLRRAFELIAVGQAKRSEIANDYAWALMIAERFEDALPVLDIAIESNPFPLTSMLNKCFILRVLGKSEEADRLFQQVLPLAPLDRRVFAGLRVEDILIGA